MDSRTVGRALEHAACTRQVHQRIVTLKRKFARDHHEMARIWQVVSQRFQFVVCLVDRRLGLCHSILSGQPTKGKGARVFGLVSHRLSSSRTRSNQRPAQLQQHRHV